MKLTIIPSLQMQESKSQLIPSSHHQIITIHPEIPITNPCRKLRAEPKSVFKVDMEQEGQRLGDGNLARLALLMLGDDNGEQTVLHGCRDGVLVDARRESEGPAEFSNAALRDPELGFRLLGLSRLLLLGDSGGTLSSTLILNCSLVSLVTVCILDGTMSRSTLDKASWWSTRGVTALGAALDGQGVGVGEFDLDILLLDSGKFAVEFVRILEFLDVELWGKSLQGGATILLTLAAVLIEVVKHTKEWLKGVSRIGSEEGSREERHLAFWCYWFE